MVVACWFDPSHQSPRCTEHAHVLKPAGAAASSLQVPLNRPRPPRPPVTAHSAANRAHRCLSGDTCPHPCRMDHGPPALRRSRPHCGIGQRITGPFSHVSVLSISRLRVGLSSRVHTRHPKSNRAADAQATDRSVTLGARHTPQHPALPTRSISASGPC